MTDQDAKARQFAEWMDRPIIIRPDSITCRCGRRLWAADWGMGPQTSIGELLGMMGQHSLEEGCPDA